MFLIGNDDRSIFSLNVNLKFKSPELEQKKKATRTQVFYCQLSVMPFICLMGNKTLFIINCIFIVKTSNLSHVRLL